MSIEEKYNPVQALIAPALNIAMWVDKKGAEYVYDGITKQNLQLDNHTLSHILSIKPEIIALGEDKADQMVDVLTTETDKYQTLKLVLELMDSNLSLSYRKGIAIIIEEKLSQKSIQNFVMYRLKGTLIPPTFLVQNAINSISDSQILLLELFKDLEVSNELLSSFLTLFKREIILNRTQWQEVNAVLTDSGSWFDIVKAIKKQSRTLYYDFAKVAVANVLFRTGIKIPIGKFTTIEKGLLDNYFLVLYDDITKNKLIKKESSIVYNDVLMMLLPGLGLKNNSSRIMQQVEILKKRKNYTEIIYILNTDKLLAESNQQLYFERALANFYLEYYEQSLQDCNAGLQLAKNPNIDFLKATNLFYLNKREESIKLLQKLISIFPYHFPLFYNIGVLYFLSGNTQKALDNYLKAFKLKPDNEYVLYGMGNVYLINMDYKRAVTCYEKSLEIAESYVKAYYNRGIAWYLIGDYTKAIKDFTAAISFDANMYEAYHNRGTIYLETQDYVKALSDFSRTLQLDPENEDAQKKYNVTIKFVQGPVIGVISKYSKVYSDTSRLNNEQV